MSVLVTARGAALASAEEAARATPFSRLESPASPPDGNCGDHTAPNGTRLARESVCVYRDWLASQEVHDDLRHANFPFVRHDFSVVGGVPAAMTRGSFFKQSYRDAGKAGIAWDSSFLLAEHVLKCCEQCASASAPAPAPATTTSTAIATNAAAVYSHAREVGAALAQIGLGRRRRPVVVELGCGIGVAGIAIAAAVAADVFLTDLGKALPLAKENIVLNGLTPPLPLTLLHATTMPPLHEAALGAGEEEKGHVDKEHEEQKDPVLDYSEVKGPGAVLGAGPVLHPGGLGRAAVSALPWGGDAAAAWAAAELNGRAVDLIIGADVVVPDLYDTGLLLDTLVALAASAPADGPCGAVVVLVSKHRRTGALEPFHAALRKRFAAVTVAEVGDEDSALRHPAKPFVVVCASGVRL